MSRSITGNSLRLLPAYGRFCTTTMLREEKPARVLVRGAGRLMSRTTIDIDSAHRRPPAPGHPLACLAPGLLHHHFQGYQQCPGILEIFPGTNRNREFIP